MPRPIPALAVAVLLLGPLTACGSDDSESASNDNARTPSSTPPSTTDAEETPSAPSDEESSTGSGGDAGAEPTGTDKEYCDEVADARKDLIDEAGGGIAVGAAVQALADIASLAPDEVRTEWQSVSSTAAKVQTALSKAGLEAEDLSNPQALGQLKPKQQRILTEGLQGVDIAQLQQDSTAITEHVSEVCGITLSPDGAP